ncbi:MAG: OadG family protein [Sedimentisphaeraceae bacterium JB056]
MIDQGANFMEGVEFMVVGMGVVFSFLVLMVIVMQVNAAVITRFFPEKEEPVQQASGAGGDRAKIAAAIAIARAQKA